MRFHARMAAVAAVLACACATAGPARASSADPESELAPDADAESADEDPIPPEPSRSPSARAQDGGQALGLFVELLTTGGFVFYSRATPRGATSLQLLVRRSGVAVTCRY